MESDKEKRHEEIGKSLTQLDLQYNSLKNEAKKLISQATDSRSAPSQATYHHSLRLSEDCSEMIRDLCDRLQAEDLDSCLSALSRVDLAVKRASKAKTPTLWMVNIWRVIEATELLLNDMAEKYGYARQSEQAALELTEGQKSKAAELAKLFEEYEDVMTTRASAPSPAGPPFANGILRWRGSQLFYVGRTEDAARWIELDPDYQREIIDVEGLVELVEARTIDGHIVTIRIDLKVDEDQVDNYILSQKGSEYYVLGAQFAGEQGKRRGR